MQTTVDHPYRKGTRISVQARALKGVGQLTRKQQSRIAHIHVLYYSSVYIYTSHAVELHT